MYRMITQDMFAFFIGPEKTAINVHRNCFQHISEPLHTRMNGSILADQTRYCELSYIEPEIFMALAEYAYRGYLIDSIAAFASRHGGPDPDKEDKLRIGVAHAPHLREIFARNTPAKERFHILGRKQPYEMNIVQKLPSNREADLNKLLEHQSSYLFYAKVATAAQIYEIVELEFEALGLLHFLLKTALIASLAPRTVLELLKYVTSAPEAPKAPEALREIVVGWFAATGISWPDGEEYHAILQENEDLTLELLILSTDPKYYSKPAGHLRRRWRGPRMGRPDEVAGGSLGGGI